MSATHLIHDLRRRGFSLAAAGGALEVRPARDLTAADRGAIREHLPELVRRLGGSKCATAPEPALARETLRLLEVADALVGRLGADGRQPLIAVASAQVTSAVLTGDRETVEFAVAEFEVVVRRVASQRHMNERAGSSGEHRTAESAPVSDSLPHAGTGYEP